MFCTIENTGPYVLVCLRGQLLSRSASGIYDDIVSLSAAPKVSLLVDLEGVTGASSTGCRVLFVTARLLHVKGGRLAIFGAKPEVLASLRGRGADHAFQNFANAEEASRYLSCDCSHQRLDVRTAA